MTSKRAIILLALPLLAVGGPSVWYFQGAGGQPASASLAFVDGNSLNDRPAYGRTYREQHFSHPEDISEASFGELSDAVMANPHQYLPAPTNNMWLGEEQVKLH